MGIPIVGFAGAVVFGFLSLACDSQKEKKAKLPRGTGSQPALSPGGIHPKLPGERGGVPPKAWNRYLKTLFSAPRSHRQGSQLAELLRYDGVRGINFEREVLPLARQLSPSKTASPEINWKGLSNEERVQVLQVSSLLLAVRKEEKGFYTAAPGGPQVDNQAFLDTVHGLIAGGKVTIRNYLGRGARLYHQEEDFILYDSLKNELGVGAQIKLGDPDSTSRILHEWYHLYQDHLGKKISQEETEAQAYLKQGEYLWWIFQKENAGKAISHLENFIQKTFPEDKPRETFLPALALRAVYFKKMGDDPSYQASLKQLKREINIQYYLLGIFEEKFEGAKRTFMGLVQPGERTKDWEESLAGLQEKIAVQREFVDKKFRRLKAFMKTAPQAPDTPFVQEMRERLSEVMESWMVKILLKKFPSAVEAGPGLFRLDISPKEPAVRRMLEEMAALRPTRYYSSVFNGL